MVHRWYTRPVFFVSDVNRAIRFYVDMLGFEKGWHKDKVGQVNLIGGGVISQAVGKVTDPGFGICRHLHRLG